MFLNILGKLGGRKFLVALFGTLAIALHAWLGLDEQSILAVGGIVAAYVRVGTSLGSMVHALSAMNSRL